MGRAVRRDRRADRLGGRGEPARAAAGRGAGGLVPRGPAAPRSATGSARSTRRWPSRRSATLPGAREAIDAVRRHGGTVVVVTGKYEPNARLHLDHLGLEVDELVGWLWGPRKADALLEHGATVYVGDHVGDIEGARAAGAVSVGVPTGPVSADELRAAGADVVLARPHRVPGLAGRLRAAAPAGRPGRAAGRPRLGGRRVLRRRRLGVPAGGRRPRARAPRTWSRRPR